MVDLAARLRREHSHLMFAAHATFKKVLVLELARWTEGMPMSVYRQMLARYGLPDLPPIEGVPKIVRTVKRDIDDFGRMGLTVLPTSPG
jgi:uncharacterized 2Fe-2S/4Fe-4S cluster protein (DUF4445 family)